MKLRFVKIQIITLLLCSPILFYTCGQQSEPEKSLESQVVIEQPDNIKNKIEQAKTVIYSLPSPIQTAMLLKHAKVEYNEELLNPTNRVNDYNTIKKKALNMGIYGADLSYTSIFEQQQATINYMVAVKNIAEGLDIMDIVDEETKNRLEENFNDRDSVLAILSHTFMKSNAILSESRSTALTSLVLFGGWIEGLYIATQLAKNSTTINNALIDRIADQALSLEIVINLLNDNQDNPDVKTVLLDAEELIVVFSNFTKITDLGDISHDDYYKKLEPELLKLIENTAKMRNDYTS